MAYPPPYLPRETVTAHARQEWQSHIRDLLHRARGEGDPRPTPDTPP